MTIVEGVVNLNYQDLLKSDCNLNSQIEEAFGNRESCLGVCFVKNVPGLKEKRAKLLLLASKLANLPVEELKAMEDADSHYSFGWSHGKEIMNGKADFAKGSFYNNPIYNDPSVECKTPDGYKENFAAYSGPNVWPKDSLPKLKEAFMELGSLIVEVGKLVSLHCDKYLKTSHPDLPPSFLQNMIRDSITHKARLLHYFPMSKEELEAAVGEEKGMDSWCGIHVDHSVLTGLTSAMYFDETEKASEKFTEVKEQSCGEEVGRVLKEAGLYIKNRDGSFTQARIPEDCLAFQIGEAAQIASRGSLIATPHLVRGAAYPFLSRNTFAVFMQPNVEDLLKPDYSFADFTADVMKRHYA